MWSRDTCLHQCGRGDLFRSIFLSLPERGLIQPRSLGVCSGSALGKCGVTNGWIKAECVVLHCDRLRWREPQSCSRQWHSDVIPAVLLHSPFHGSALLESFNLVILLDWSPLATKLAVLRLRCCERILFLHLNQDKTTHTCQISTAVRLFTATTLLDGFCCCLWTFQNLIQVLQMASVFLDDWPNSFLPAMGCRLVSHFLWYL